MNSLTTLLFIAMSDSQEHYFNALVSQKNISGKVIRVKHFKHGNFKNGESWAQYENLDVQKWLEFKIKKEELNTHFYGLKRLFKYFLYRDVLCFADAFRKVTSDISPDALVLLNGAHYKQQAAISIAEKNHIPIIYFELGCLPNTTMVDTQGVNANCSIPREKKFYEEYSSKTSNTLPSTLIPRESKKDHHSLQNLPEKFFFVPFQVHDDTQILLQSPWVKSMEKLYGHIETSLDHLSRDYVFVIKEHPSDNIKYSHLYKRNNRIIFANGNNTQELIEKSSGILTINSTVGIEALLFNKPVITLGNSFYNIKTLSHHANNQDELNTLISCFEDLPFNKKITDKFLHYLIDHHLIEGRPKHFDSQHLEKMSQKIKHFLS